MTFKVTGTAAVVNSVIRFLKEETTFRFEIGDGAPETRSLELIFGEKMQPVYGDYFMNWLDGSGRTALTEKNPGFMSKFESITAF